MLHKLRHLLVLIIVALLPFHALLVTYGTELIYGPGHSPVLFLALWKEALITVILLIIFFELFFVEKKKLAQIIKGGAKWKFSLDKVTWCALGIILLSLVTELWTDVPDMQWAYGFKYTVFPLIVFLMCRKVSWEEDFLDKKIIPVLMFVSGVIALYGIVSFFLPQSLFSALGYSDAHSIYAPGSSLSAFQQISGTSIRRIQSTFAGPNQLAIWLLIPWSISLVIFLKTIRNKKSEALPTTHPSSLRFAEASYPLPTSLILSIFTLTIIGAALVLAFSRSAWIAAFVITIIAICIQLKGRTKVITLSSIVGFVIASVLVIYLSAPELIDRSISNKHHFERTRDGVIEMFKNPLGHGLGTAGPASNRFSDACMHFDKGADISWASDRNDLCLFVEGEQVQPSDRACTCPVLPENWYVQVGYELGIVGFMMFVALVVFVIKRGQAPLMKSKICCNNIILAFLGVSIAALFLHAFEDSAVAYTLWILVGISLSALCKK